jgi:hypothetical protein
MDLARRDVSFSILAYLFGSKVLMIFSVCFCSALYRDVPTVDEIEGEGNFMPVYAQNAEQLIDYAMTFVHPSTLIMGSY